MSKATVASISRRLGKIDSEEEIKAIAKLVETRHKRIKEKLKQIAWDRCKRVQVGDCMMQGTTGDVYWVSRIYRVRRQINLGHRKGGFSREIIPFHMWRDRWYPCSPNPLAQEALRARMGFPKPDPE